MTQENQNKLEGALKFKPVKNAPIFYGEDELKLSVAKLGKDGYAFYNMDTGALYHTSMDIVQVGKDNLDGYVLIQKKDGRIMYFNPITRATLEYGKIVKYNGSYNFWKELLRVSPEDFKNLPNKYFEETLDAEIGLQDYIISVKQALQRRVQDRVPTKKDQEYAKTILDIVNKKIETEKEAIKKREAEKGNAKQNKKEYDAVLAEFDKIGKISKEGERE